MTDTPSFEIPAQLRELAEKNVEQARAAYGQFMDFITQTISAWPKTPANAMTSGFGAVQQRAIAFATENAESAFAVAREFAAAKDIKDADPAKPLCADSASVLRTSGPGARQADD